MANYMEAYLVEEFGQTSEPAKILGIREKAPIYDAVRQVLRPEYSTLSDAEIGAVVQRILRGMSPEEVEGFWDTLKDVGKAALGVARQVAPTILPIAGGAAGTFLGGPAGTAIGAQLGQMGAQLIARPKQPSAPAPSTPIGAAPQPSPFPQVPQAPSATIAAPVPPGGTSATAQILALIRNPIFLQGLLGQVLGGAGKSTVQAGAQQAPIPTAAMMNALGALSTQAAAETAEVLGDEDSVEAMEYLKDESGNFLVDPANPDERAQRVLALLNETSEATVPKLYDPVTEWFIEANLLP
ncbi:MAG: hypothetical protein WAM73_04515 [Desulfobacterales bacterium]